MLPGAAMSRRSTRRKRVLQFSGFGGLGGVNSECKPGLPGLPRSSSNRVMPKARTASLRPRSWLLAKFACCKMKLLGCSGDVPVGDGLLSVDGWEFPSASSRIGGVGGAGTPKAPIASRNFFEVLEILCLGDDKLTSQDFGLRKAMEFLQAVGMSPSTFSKSEPFTSSHVFVVGSVPKAATGIWAHSWCRFCCSRSSCTCRVRRSICSCCSLLGHNLGDVAHVALATVAALGCQDLLEVCLCDGATHWLHCPRVAGYACGGIEMRSA